MIAIRGNYLFHTFCQMQVNKQDEDKKRKEKIMQ